MKNDPWNPWRGKQRMVYSNTHFVKILIQASLQFNTSNKIFNETHPVISKLHPSTFLAIVKKKYKILKRCSKQIQTSLHSCIPPLLSLKSSSLLNRPSQQSNVETNCRCSNITIKPHPPNLCAQSLDGKRSLERSAVGDSCGAQENDVPTFDWTRAPL